jgi:hypothetical protein
VLDMRYVSFQGDDLVSRTEYGRNSVPTPTLTCLAMLTLDISRFYTISLHWHCKRSSKRCRRNQYRRLKLRGIRDSGKLEVRFWQQGSIMNHDNIHLESDPKRMIYLSLPTRKDIERSWLAMRPRSQASCTEPF